MKQKKIKIRWIIALFEKWIYVLFYTKLWEKNLREISVEGKEEIERLISILKWMHDTC